MSDSMKSANAESLKGQKGMVRILKAGGYSLAGLRAAYRNEAAFRQLVLLNFVLLPVALILDVSRTERAILMIVPLLSLAIELLNSAIENVVDRVSLELHPLSKNAKDMGSAAQFIGLLIIAIAWGVILI